MKKYYAAGAVTLIFASIYFSLPLVLDRLERQREIAVRSEVVLPAPKPLDALGGVSSLSLSQSTDINWDVPFTSQAPLFVWDETHQEACEEASVLMVLKYFRGEKFSSPEQTDRELLQLVEDNAALGFPVDDTAEQVMELIRYKDPSLNVKLIRDPDANRLKRELSNGALVIVPAAGRELKNPYFRRPGPIYHMLVLRGFTVDGHVITNDPGTRRGEEFVYSWERLLGAAHDWNHGQVEEGDRVVLAVSKTSL